MPPNLPDRQTARSKFRSNLTPIIFNKRNSFAAAW